MGSHRNFKNIGNGQPPEGSGGGGGRPTGNSPLARQPSIYSLTFDEFQNSLGGFGKDFGSMNMDEFLKNVWTAEESQAMASAFGGTEGGFAGGNLQRQGSLTLPRTLSQKTVDEVWRELYKEGSGCKDGSGNGGSNLQQRQPTLGEITLEEFLLRAGVVREETQSAKGPNNNSGFYGELSHSNDNTGLALGYPQLGQNNGIGVNRNAETNNQFHNQSPNFAMNVNGVRSSQQQQQQQPQLFLNQSTMAYASQLQLANNTQLANPGMRDEMVGIGDPTMNNGFFQGGAVQGGGTGMMDLGAGGVTVASESPANQLSSDGLRRRNEDTSSLSPVPFVFSRGVGGKKGTGAVEKVVERRQRRMIKNRESAARSRARKQAYTMELEAEVAKLKEENRKLQKKQVEFMEMQKNQDFETGNPQKGTKRRCLRRTQTGPW